MGKPVKILICGRQASGKSFLARQICKFLQCPRFNGDIVRKMTKNSDFSMLGRLRQAYSMKLLAESVSGVVVCDFICPTKELRKVFAPDIIIFCAHPGSGNYENTDKLFEPPQINEAAHVLNFVRGEEKSLINFLSLVLRGVFSRR